MFSEYSYKNFVLNIFSDLIFGSPKSIDSNLRISYFPPKFLLLFQNMLFRLKYFFPSKNFHKNFIDSGSFPYDSIIILFKIRTSLSRRLVLKVPVVIKHTGAGQRQRQCSGNRRIRLRHLTIIVNWFYLVKQYAS